jgi:hypothetical protein
MEEVPNVHPGGDRHAVNADAGDPVSTVEIGPTPYEGD